MDRLKLKADEVIELINNLCRLYVQEGNIANFHNDTEYVELAQHNYELCKQAVSLLSKIN